MEKSVTAMQTAVVTAIFAPVVAMLLMALLVMCGLGYVLYLALPPGGA